MGQVFYYYVGGGSSKGHKIVDYITRKAYPCIWGTGDSFHKTAMNAVGAGIHLPMMGHKNMHSLQ